MSSDSRSSERSSTYAGDVSVDQAWGMLREDQDATLVDVRTKAEWTFVGEPDLSSIGKSPLRISWQEYPGMKVNDAFVSMMESSIPKHDNTLLFLCRSGGRSRAAAVAMTAAGYTRCFNIAGGFEGDRDENGHRGSVGGWKAAALPWTQS